MSPTHQSGSQRLEAEINQYIESLGKERRLSGNTIKAYQRDLHRFLEFLNTRKLSAWPDVDSRTVRAFIGWLNQQGIAGKSIQRMLSGCRTFFESLLKQGSVNLNPFDGASAPRSPRKLPETLSVDELSALLERHDDSTISIRDHAILELFYTSGMRLSELAGLDIDKLDIASGEILVTGKGSRQRVVPVGKKARQSLLLWQKHRSQLAARDEPALFVNNRGTRLGVRGIQYRLNNWAKKAGFGRHVHPHMLRHSFASHILESSGDLRAVQEMLGHADISTTQIYTHLDFQHLARVYDGAHPRARSQKNKGS